MSYVKISDPAIIDLAGIQQIISVVNQHTDYLNVLINRFGTIVTPEWDSDTAQGIYDPATHNIAFGKDTIEANDDNKATVPSNNKVFYQKQFDYNGITFSEKPYITLSADNSSGTDTGQLDVILSVHNVTTTGFVIRAVRSGFYNNKQTIDNKIKINWIAIGPR